MLYRETPPHPRLAPYVRTCWTLAGTAAELGPQPVLPDGCTELIVHRGRPFWRHDAHGSADRQATRLFVGQMRAPVVIAPDGDADIVAIRFEPFGAFALIGTHQTTPADQIIEADALDERWLTRAIQQAESADTADVALRMLQDALLARLDRQRAPIVDTRVITAARALMRTHGAMTVDAIARHAATSARHLERLFQEQIGTSPKRFARVLRFQSAANAIAAEHAHAPAFADISASAGYFDQAHMIREFVTLAGTTPGEFRRSLGALTKAMLS